MILLAVIAFSAGISGGCTHSAISPEATDVGMPAGWVRGGDSGAVDINWLESFDDPQLTSLVSEAITNNYLLEQERVRLYQAERTVIIVRANRFPDLDVSLDGSRRGFTDTSGQRATVESFGADIGARWEVDLWGRLSKQQQAAQLALGAQQARFESVQRDLAAATTGAYFGVMEANQLLAVARRRLDNAIESHDIVASGYRQGLNDALDLYLARNQVERQKANYAQQEQTLKETIADLQLSLARYPDGHMEMPGVLPVMTEPIPSGLPSELLTRRTDLQEAWLNLLAADADLAAAHKARFPSLTLVGSAGVTSVAFAELLDSDLSVWSIAGGVTQPLFNAGRLEAFEEQAAAQVRQAEQQYLDLVFRAFAEVENAISRSVSLRERYESFLDADSNSGAALELALEQYQRGLVPYTTVLESQRQAFDAESTVVQLRNLLLQNRISLYLALGGEFATKY
ncbi:MAG: TolC family protein [Proteobacteria bacterium]|nr:TolC family protein [Pseudomonadota bacterium]